MTDQQEPPPPRNLEAEDAHGGSMAPDLVSDTGEPVGEPPPSSPPADATDGEGDR